MKRFLIITIKWLLLIFFLHNINFFSLFSNTENSPVYPEKADGGKADREYLNEKIKRAEKLGPDYGPEEYFADLAEIKLKEKRLEFDRRAVMQVNYSLNTIFGAFNRNVLENRKRCSDKEYEKFMERLSSAREKCLTLIDPEQAKRDAEKISPEFWKKALFSILLWLLNSYLLNLPLAFILLWIWWYQKKEKIRITNPLSFFICLLFYPVTIIHVWSKSVLFGARGWAMEIELRKRKADIFSLLSDDELADINLFARSNLKIGDYRRYLNYRGLKRQHSLLPAAIAATAFLLISFFPNRTTSGNEMSGVNKIAPVQKMIKAPPDINPDSAFHYHCPDFCPAILSAILNEEAVIIHSFIIQKVALPPQGEKCSGFKTNPDPIPLFG